MPSKEGLAAPLSSPLLFGAGTLFIGFGAGLFGHGTLTATMSLAPKNQTGLALGVWGAVQASAAGIAIALGGIFRDAIAAMFSNHILGPVLGYDFVYCFEVVLLCATLITIIPLTRYSAVHA